MDGNQRPLLQENHQRLETLLLSKVRASHHGPLVSLPKCKNQLLIRVPIAEHSVFVISNNPLLSRYLPLTTKLNRWRQQLLDSAPPIGGAARSSVHRRGLFQSQLANFAKYFAAQILATSFTITDHTMAGANN